jgi:rfaE bifunctional protein kinase chain/domain
MSEIDGLKREQARPKEAGQPGEAGQFKEKSPNQLSLSDVVFRSQSKAHVEAQAGDHQMRSGLSAKNTVPSNFEAIFGAALVRSLDPQQARVDQAREFRWQAAKANFRELPKQWGRKFLQPGKTEVKDLKEHKLAGDKQHISPSKEASEPGKPESSKPVAPKKEKSDKRAPDRDKDDKLTGKESAIDLEVETIYDEQDYLEEIKRATELALGIDEAHTKGVQVFKSLEKIRPQDMGGAGQMQSIEHLSRKRLRECISKLTGGKVIVVGDLLIDELVEGSPERISREAPVLILEHVATELVPGGAANTAHNVTSLGGVCHAVGVCGKDENADKLALLLEKYHITHSLVHDPHRPTTVKTRILSRSHAIRQQLLRLDRISHATIDSVVETLLIDRLDRAAPQYSAIILSDYRAGVATDAVIKACSRAAARHSLLLVVDAQQNFERFQGATLLTPNQPDAEKAVGFTFDTPQKLRQGGEELLLLTGAKAVLITLGPDGMMLFAKGQTPFHLPVFNRFDIFDVTGAGDTVVATMTLALVTGATLEEAMALGNLAAGIVVTKPGTAVTNQQELLTSLDSIDLAEE